MGEARRLPSRRAFSSLVGRQEKVGGCRCTRIPLGSPWGELSPKVTERGTWSTFFSQSMRQGGTPSPTRLRRSTSPLGEARRFRRVACAPPPRGRQEVTGVSFVSPLASLLGKLASGAELRGGFISPRGKYFTYRKRRLPCAAFTNCSHANKKRPARIFAKRNGPLVPLTGVEPVRMLLRGILSPLCLPIPP